ncbi:MAG: VanW family protein [Christensenellales bacterium]
MADRYEHRPIRRSQQIVRRKSAPRSAAAGASRRIEAKGASRRKKRMITPRFMIISGILALLLITIVALLFAAGGKKDELSGRIAGGVSIDGIDVGGMKGMAALEKVRASIEENLSGSVVHLRHEGRVWTYNAHQLGVSDDAEEVVKKALAIGQEDSFFEKLGGMFRPKRSYSLKTTISFDNDKLAEALEEAKRLIETPMQEATVNFNPNAAAGEKVFTYTEGKIGLALDISTLIARLRQDLYDDWSADIVLEPVELLPAATMEQLQDSTVRVAQAVISFEGASPEQRHNASRALEKFNGVIMQPNETMAFNSVVGEWSGSNGFQEAMAPDDDGIEVPEMGAGVSMAATALYNAVLKAGFEIEDRWTHTLYPGWVELGRDARVRWPDMDLRFANTTGAPAYIRTFAYEESLIVYIYGRPLEKDRLLDLETEVLHKTDLPAMLELQDIDAAYVKYTDETKQVSESWPGMVVRTYLVSVGEDGQVHEKVPITKDTYPAIPGRIYRGITPRPSEPEPSEGGD